MTEEIFFLLMRKKRWVARSARSALVAGALVMSATARAVPPSAAMLSNGCAACHGTHGGSAGPAIPSLAGQSKEAIVVALKAFKSGQRPSTIMGRLAKAYTEADFEAMGDFFSSQKPHVTNQSLDPLSVAKGASLQQENCGQCHTEEGRKGKDDTPAMAGQWLPYMRMQMALYVSGARKMPGKMEEKIKALSTADVDALLHFYASVK